MASQRAVVSGSIGGLVQTRSMFTADVVESGGDTAAVLWTAYLDSIYVAFIDTFHVSYSTQSYEIQSYSGGHWIPTDVVPFVHQGTAAADALANIMSVVLVGKGAGLRKVGRKFLGVIGEVCVSGNSLVGNYVTYAAAALAAYLTAFTGIGGGTITPGIVDKLGNFVPFVGGFVSSLLGSMRRRKPGLGI